MVEGPISVLTNTDYRCTAEVCDKGCSAQSIYTSHLKKWYLSDNSVYNPPLRYMDAKYNKVL
jgi:hypothetical protein